MHIETAVMIVKLSVNCHHVAKKLLGQDIAKKLVERKTLFLKCGTKGMFLTISEVLPQFQPDVLIAKVLKRKKKSVVSKKGFT